VKTGEEKRRVKCELRKLCFRQFLGAEILPFMMQILAKNDGGIAVNVTLFSVLAARCW
jgi:hypothetical protein